MLLPVMTVDLQYNDHAGSMLLPVMTVDLQYNGHMFNAITRDDSRLAI